MMPESFGELLESALKAAEITPERNTPFFKVSEEIIEMASAYRNDGLSFLNSGDIVNAHASFAYGHGWLDFGIHSGLIKGNLPENKLPFFDENIPENLFSHLFEKTNRYRRMLFKALESVAVAPDKESPLNNFTDFTLKSAAGDLAKGDSFLSEKKYANALAYFSYGYGLVDAAVRCGLLIITDNRGLFTV